MTTCFYCGIKTTPTPKGQKLNGARYPSSMQTKDHLVPISRGGSLQGFNVVTSCLKCNRDKRDLTFEEYKTLMALRKSLIKVPNIKIFALESYRPKPKIRYMFTYAASFLFTILIIKVASAITRLA